MVDDRLVGRESHTRPGINSGLRTLEGQGFVDGDLLSVQAGTDFDRVAGASRRNGQGDRGEG